MAKDKDIDDRKKIIDELMKDDVVKEAILEFVALEVAIATKNIKANVTTKKVKKNVIKKPETFGKYFQGDKKACRACRFAKECKAKSKKV